MRSKSSSQLVSIVDDDRSVQRALKNWNPWGFRRGALHQRKNSLNRTSGTTPPSWSQTFANPGMSGLELQAKLNGEGSRIPIIFITAHGNANMKMQALTIGAVEFLSKPSR